MTTTTLDLDICTPEGKTWLALISGVDQRFGFDREFINPIEKSTSRSGMTGTATYMVGNGIYESNEGRRRYGRRYWRVADGVVTEIGRDDVVAALNS